MAKFDLNIGAQVHCKDGPCGRLIKVVLDPHTRRVTDLIVEKGPLSEEDKVLPVSLIENAAEEEIRLSVTADRLEGYAAYRQVEFFEVPSSDLQPSRRYEAGEVLYYATRYGLISIESVVPMLRQRIHQGVSPERVLVGRGTPVRNLEGEIGRVDHVLADRESGEITHLIVDTGLFSHPLILPIRMIQEMSEETILVEGASAELKNLSPYMARDDADILAEVQDRLAAAYLDEIKVALENGVVRLTGVVPDATAMRHAEAIAASVQAVLGVENDLDARAAGGSRVVAALAEDSQAGTAVVEVREKEGVVTLTGRVGSQKVREAVEEAADERSDASTVISELEVKPDEGSSS